MGENSNTAKKAKVLSDKIFSTFGWKRCPSEDVNFDCVNKVTHTAGLKKPPENPQHGVDAVFHFSDPYLGEEVYLVTELKSYAADGITKSNVTKWANRLGQSVDCANASPHWMGKYIETDGGHTVNGLLFVYNHAGDLDKSFDLLLPLSSKSIPQGHYVYIVDPVTALSLANIADDIMILRGDGKLPQNPAPIEFFHPELRTARVHGKQFGPATIETMLGPILVLRAARQEGKSHADDIFIYYRSEESSVDDMLSVIDFIFYRELLGDNTKIEVRIANDSGDSINNFKKAKTRYCDEFWAVEEGGSKSAFKRRLERISCDRVTTRRSFFSTEDLSTDDHE